VDEPSVRRLCIALKAFAEALAIAAMWLVERSRFQDCHAVVPRKATTQIARRAMTDWSNAETVKRLSMIDSPKPSAFWQEAVNIYAGLLS
jgi:hypothetical protein